MWITSGGDEAEVSADRWLLLYKHLHGTGELCILIENHTNVYRKCGCGMNLIYSQLKDT